MYFLPWSSLQFSRRSVHKTRRARAREFVLLRHSTRLDSRELFRNSRRRFGQQRKNSPTVIVAMQIPEEDIRFLRPRLEQRGESLSEHVRKFDSAECALAELKRQSDSTPLWLGPVRATGTNHAFASRALTPFVIHALRSCRRHCLGRPAPCSSLSASVLL